MPLVSAQDGPALIGVTIGSTDLPRHRKIYEAITGVASIAESLGSDAVVCGGSGGTIEHATAYNLGSARVVLASTASGGLRQLRIRVASLDVATRRLRAAGATLGYRDGQVIVDNQWSAVEVALVEQPHGMELGISAGAVLDHVAVLVTDVADMARRWTVLLGIEPDHVGVHPLGTCLAARFPLGGRMIELLSPLEGQAQVLHDRLRRAGDGAFALALIGSDTEATRIAVTATGARVLHQPPHWVVHPADAAGVPVQITPRVHH